MWWPNEPADLPRLLLSQAFALFLDLPHADRDLGGTQAFDRDGLQNRLAHVSHGFLPLTAELGLQIIIGLCSRPSTGLTTVCSQQVSRDASSSAIRRRARPHACRSSSWLRLCLPQRKRGQRYRDVLGIEKSSTGWPLGFPGSSGCHHEHAPTGAQVPSAQPCRSNFKGLWLRFNLLVTTRRAAMVDGEDSEIKFTGWKCRNTLLMEQL
jgi:hypothetical protein